MNNNTRLSVYLSGVVSILLSDPWTRKLLQEENDRRQQKKTTKSETDQEENIPTIVFKERNRGPSEFENGQLTLIYVGPGWTGPREFTIDMLKEGISIQVKDIKIFDEVLRELLDICDVVLEKIKIDTYPN